LDIANWFCGGIPHRVYVSGGIEYWRDGRTAPDTVNAIFEYRMEASNPNFVRLGSRYTPQDTLALNSTFTLRATYSYSRCSSEHGSHERVIGDRASALLRPEGDSFFQMETMSGSPPELLREHRDLLSSTLAKRLAEMTESERENFVRTRGATYDLPGYARGPRTMAPILADGSEESVEAHQFRSFAECIRKGDTPRANVMVGLAAVVAGEHAQRSLASQGPVEIDPALMAFDFEVPSITGFDENVTPIPGAMEVL
jgi:predicted dehydrogenase